ncbi:MAG: biosynthetic arginine decarboxylase [Gammaproteobacteria bacterium]|nr:biosynthetic arginine decarboxylase [Gammaproteobacteria bacterium]
MDTAPWDVERSRKLYHISHWSGGYFDSDSNGHMTAYPGTDHTAQGVSLYTLAQELVDSGLSLPVLVRFSNILHHRVDSLCSAFHRAMQRKGFHANYMAVYPIKVNQQRHVVREILTYGEHRRQGCVGLEAGSKPELMAVLALAPPDGGTVICNGYKDREYIRLALTGQRLGLHPYLIVEKRSELKTIITEAEKMGVTPRLGVRVRLASIGAGKWQNTGGKKAKFGLSSAQTLAVVEQMRANGLLGSLSMLHFHMGSQIANIRDVQRALREAARYYAQLRKLGAPIKCIDVGGGLGIDYEGTQSRSFCSINYSVQEYANNVISAFWEICTEHNLPHPNIITESGRAMTAHHAVLITNVIDVEHTMELSDPPQAESDEPQMIQDLWCGLKNVTASSAVEVYHDAVYLMSEAHSMFSHGVLDLAQHARAEQLYFATCRRIRDLLNISSLSHRKILDELNNKLADKYFCNFSLFQSAPDTWAIKQVFPIVPLNRLDERPTRRATLQDITCDSDGRIDRYVDAEGIETSLPVHSLQEEKPYLLGIFLVGAYQEILGDMHNLFGDTHSVNVKIDADGCHRLIEPEMGDTVEDMLRYVRFDVDSLRSSYRKRLQATSLSADQQQICLNELQAGLTGYTYLGKN